MRVEMVNYVFCQNIDSQVQGEENAVSLSGSQQAAEEEEDMVS